MTALTVALAAGDNTLSPGELEPWVTVDQLGMAQADESVDLSSVCTVATEILFLLSGKRYGVRTETIRPTLTEGSCFPFGTSSSELFLNSPVQELIEVKIDGDVLDESEYTLYDERRLVRNPTEQGLGQSWPLWQRLDLADSEVGTFSVRYQWGRPVTAGAQLAAQTFATELAKYVIKEPCALPDRVVSVTRQGISQTLIDPSQFIKEARTGLYLVDTWLGAVNPNGNRRRPTVTGPDSPQLTRAANG